MSRFGIAFGVSLLALASCATDATVQLAESDLPGTYVGGDGPGTSVTIVLEPNRSFTSDWEGCLGVFGETKGTWRLDGDQIRFEQQSGDPVIARYLTSATTIRHKGQIGFARAEYVNRNRISDSLILLKKPDQ